VALTRADPGNGDGEPNAARLELKRDTESHLARKAAAVLDRAFGAGQALASVDVTLNMDQIRTTTEDVLPAASRAGLQATGVVVRERETLRDAGSAGEAKLSDGARGGSAQRDVEYAVGRRIEQVVSQPGSIRRIHVVAVVRQALDAAQEEQLRKLLAAAVGASPERGDAVVIQSLAGKATPAFEAAMPFAADAGADSSAETGTDAETSAAHAPRLFGDVPLPQLLLVGLLIVAMVLLLLSRGGGRRTASRHEGTGLRTLSDAERAAALQRVRDWMGHGGSLRAGDSLPHAGSGKGGGGSH
jgi:flagellar M-ring protein FliF